MIGRLLTAALFSVLIGFGRGAAQTPAPESSDTAISIQEAEDAALVRAALQSSTARGPLAIGDQLEQLRRAAARAPARYPLWERRGDSFIVRGEVDFEALAARLMGPAGKSSGAVSVIRAFNTYPVARLLLAAYAFETHRYQDALSELDAGLAIQPENPELVSQKAAALEMLHRPAEALAVVRPWLADHPLAGEDAKARLLSAQGFALTELGRLDEAEAAYAESLKAQPNHPEALRELTYIRRLRSGGPRSAVGIQIGDEPGADARSKAPR